MRPPDKVIKQRDGSPYLERWHVIPRNKWFNIYAHRFLGDDDHKDLHDHAWWSMSFLLKGSLLEWIPTHMGFDYQKCRIVNRFWPVIRSPGFSHRLQLNDCTEAWTIFITGPVIRPWGFITRRGWIVWTEIIDGNGNRLREGNE